MQIYLARNNVQAGPYTLEQLNTMLQSQEVSLDDLMWHEGMAEWKKIGEVTHGQMFYAANAAAVNNHNTNTTNKLTVDELYGRQPSQQSTEANLQEIEKLINSEGGKAKIITVGMKTSSLKYELANISSRMLAVLIDQLLFFICFIPLILNIDKESLKQALQVKDIAKMQQYVEGLPPSALALFLGLFFSNVIIQVFMLVKRGQTLGKIMNGIRILDVKTDKVPSVTNLILLRTIVTNIAYSVPVLGDVILIIDAIIMMTDKERRSLHDKLAGTYVVKAKNEQLNNQNNNISNNIS